jgi:hypothetical protein
MIVKDREWVVFDDVVATLREYSNFHNDPSIGHIARLVADNHWPEVMKAIGQAQQRGILRPGAFNAVFHQYILGIGPVVRPTQPR